jgi:hypothetical protein
MMVSPEDTSSIQTTDSNKFYHCVLFIPCPPLNLAYFPPFTKYFIGDQGDDVIVI